ncbi:MAG TPA: DNA polymerase/3'-5' exonuclease PolX [Actinomycetota bacterium]|nr:DNA polymerase/3'-5' exonuclease PolX [Actinomycetota bacterium]
MPRANDAVEAMLVEYADLQSILFDDPYKPRAYEKAARAVGGYPVDLEGKDLTEILKVPSVGRSIGEKIQEFLETGSLAELEALREKIPAGVRELTRIPGLGPKKAMVLYQELGVGSVEELEAAIDDDRVAALPRFGAKTQENIARGLRQLRSSGGRVKIDTALDVAEGFIAHLSALRQARRVAYAGSLRRKKESIGDVDLLVAGSDATPVMDAFVAHPSVARVLAHGDTKSSVVTSVRLQVDLRVVPSEAWGAAMIYFTGSKAHNIRIREMAVRQGLKLSEYGLFDAKSGELLAADTEEAVYARLGMAPVDPALREDRGEVEAALAGELPTLVTERQLKGDLHTHTNLTDGLASLEDMVARGVELGYVYFAITDHAPNLYMQRMTEDKILAQRERVERLRATYPKMTLLHGTELNIDPDGDVDWDAAFLAGFDLTVASVHSHFAQSRDDMTARVIRAIENPFVDIIGHLTTRQIGKRPPVDLDLEAVFEAAGRTGTAMEINSHPDRLDLSDEHVLWARRHGVRFAVNTDAHAVPHLDHRRFGVGMAQRGWLTKDDVINAWPLSKLRRFLAAHRP